MACVATTHLPEVNEKAKARFEAVRKQHPQEIHKQEMTKAYFQTGLDYMRLYAPSVIVSGLSITGFWLAIICCANAILPWRQHMRRWTPATRDIVPAWPTGLAMMWSGKSIMTFRRRPL